MVLPTDALLAPSKNGENKARTARLPADALPPQHTAYSF